MRVITHKHDTSAQPKLPDAASVYESALECLDRSHENDAAACLASCRLEIVAAHGTYPLREELVPIGDTMATLERNPEIRGRVRQALDNVLGPKVYLTQMALSTCSKAIAA
jgi:hypothetical protein